MRDFLSTLILALLFLSPSVSFAQSSFSTSNHASNAAPSHSSAAPATASFAQKLSLRGVPNAGQVSEQLFRGAQPKLDALGELKKLGITTIVSLRSGSSHTHDAERARAESLGMHFVSIPVGGFSNPTSEQLARFFSLLRQSPKEKVFVHCMLGDDRTGVFVAAYRVAFDHWTPNQALSEMKAFGFNHTWHHGMTVFVRDLPNRLQSDPVLRASLN
jgi:protein tyrosine/serine phosphatase